ncbi:mas-related G-protein coupled receptor member F isoform X2 [Erinaceus europaeus]|nr:mas-related G-protein coupled receptor member F isoform X2 [Erinaceus europaeus]
MEQLSPGPPPAPALYAALLLGLLGLLGNALVLRVLGCGARRGPFAVYLLHLAGADATFLLSRALAAALSAGPVGGAPAAYLGALCRLAGLCGLLAGVGLLPALSAERLACVLWPGWFWRRRPAHLAAVACGLLWALALLATGLHHYFCAFLGPAGAAACGRADAGLGVLLFLVCCPLMVLPCLALVLLAECRAPRRRPSAKLTHVVLALVAVFLVSSIYLGVDCFLFWVFHIPAPFPEYVTDLCLSLNAGAKPVVYFLAGRDRSQRLWEPFRVVLQRALRDGGEPGEPGEALEMQAPRGNSA